MVKMHLNGHLKKKTGQKLQLKEDNWNSYLTENKFKISDEERIQKKKLYMSKNNCMIRSSSSSSSSAADGKKSRDRKSREVNALDLLMMDNDDDENIDHNSTQKIVEDTVNERHKTFLPASATSSSSSKMRKNRLPVTASPSPSSGCVSTALRRRTVDTGKEDIELLSEDTAVAEMDGSHSSTVRGKDQKQAHVKTSISSSSSSMNRTSSSSSRRLISMKPDPDWKHITSNIRSLYAELRYYEELSGKRSILDTREELDDMLMDKELNDPQSSKAIMQYLLELVCQSLTYLLKNEVELQEERSKNDLLNAQLDDYRSGRMHDPQPITHPYTTGLAGTTTTTASVPQNDYSLSTPSLHAHASINESMADTHPYSVSTPHTPSNSMRLPVSVSITRGDDDHNDNTLTSLSKMQALGQLSAPYVDAYASYMDSPIRMGDHRVDRENSGGGKSSGGGITGSNPPKHLFPSVLDLSRMDALINYSKAITVDNECSTIDRLTHSMAASSHHSMMRTNSSGRPIDGYDSDDSVPPPPPPSHVVASSYRMPPPLPPVVISSAQEQMQMKRVTVVSENAPVSRITSKQDAAISMRMMNHGGRMNNATGDDGNATTPVMMQSRGHAAVDIELMKTTKTAPSPMTMNGSSASDWLFFDFSTPTPYYTGLPPHQSSSSATTTSTTTTHLYPSGISSSIAGNNDHYDGGRGEFYHRPDDHYDQHSRGASVLGQEQPSRRKSMMTEQVSIVQPLVDVPVPHTAPTHPYIHHQARISSRNSATDHAVSYQVPDDSGLSPIAKELMNQYRLPLQQRTFDARNGSF